MKKLVVVDISSFIFRAFYAIRPLHAPDKTPVNAVYGILHMMLRLMEEQKPTHMLLARDSKEKSFREDLYPEYKANRSAPPDDLIPQFALVDSLVDKMGLPSLRVHGFEADDIIGSVVTQYKKEFDEVMIVTGDKDLMQFVGEHVVMLDTMKNIVYKRGEVFDKMGVYPEQIVDYLSLVGDSSDNIPGVKGIGAKGAAKLLEEFGTLENCLANVDKISGKKAQQSLIEGKEDALLSKKLVTIITDMNLGLSSSQMSVHFQPTVDLQQFLLSLGFSSALKKLNIVEEKAPAAVKEKKKFQWNDWKDKKEIGLVIHWPEQQTLFNIPELILADEVNISPVPDAQTEEIMSLIAQSEMTIVGCHLKKFCAYLFERNISLKAKLFDLILAHFVVDANQKHEMKTLAQGYLNKIVQTPEEEAECLIELKNELLSRMKEANVDRPFYELDIPLMPILAKMEVEGIQVDIPYFSHLEEKYDEELRLIQKQIADISGVEINLNSPKQVGTLLFEKLNLPVIKENKTGPSTDSEVLEELASMKLSEIPDLILKHRELEKIQSTYVRVLPKLVDHRDGRLHTHFHQHVAATGRLSSDQPNLQNIPIRTENGRRLRKGFVAPTGKKLMGADYSQIELRLLAHFSEDAIMVDAFLRDQDIHAQTAAQVFHIPLDEVSKDQRSFAKAVNFGLMYGQSSFGLSQALRISRKEAQDFITRYFTRFASVKSYLDSLKELAEKTGYSETYFGRKRLLPDIHSSNRTVKSMAERMAINSPIQGTAADIIKKAMIDLDRALTANKFEAKLILQVHDELILEYPPTEEEALKKVVLESMEQVVKLKVPLRVDLGVGQDWFEI